MFVVEGGIVLTSNRWAYKEWAAVCGALVAGRQSVLLRKGGIAEGPRGFEVEHSEFWLFATRFHQSAEELSDEGRAFLSQEQPAGVLIPAYARIDAVHWIDDERLLPRLAGLHVLSERTVSERFHYRQPGLFVLTARVFVPPKSIVIPDSPHFAGCRTWVDLPSELPTEGLTPVLDDATYRDWARRVDSAVAKSASV